MKELKGKRVLIFQQRGWAMTIGSYLAKEFKKRGCELSAITLKKTTHNSLINQKEVEYKYIFNVDDIINDPKQFINKNVTLEEICDDLGVDSIWPLIQSNRLLAKSYQKKYYYSYRQNVSDEHIINYFKAFYLATKEMFEKFKPDFVIVAAFIFEGHAILELFCKKHKIPIVGINDSKVKDYYIFVNDFFCTKGKFFKRVDELNNGLDNSINAEKARKYIKEFRNNFKEPSLMIDFKKKQKNKTIWLKIKSELSPFKQVLSWYIKGKPKHFKVNYLNNIGSQTDIKTPKIILRDYFLNKKYTRIALKMQYNNFKNIKKFVYFPLQFQPEGAIDAMAPHFNNQIETARLVAMSLPGDLTLVVKDHPAMLGQRNPSYLEKIKNLPNVKLIDFRIASEEVLKKCDLLVSPNGTTISEAAFLKKPVIQLGNLGTTLKLPNVFKHTDMTTLSKKIKEVLNINFDTEDYERKLENYVAAVYDTGCNIAYHKIWDGSDKKSTESLFDIYIKELEEYEF